MPAGESGSVLVTDLHNFAMPFIRYDNGDVASLVPQSAGPCACGRGLRRIASVEGRRADTLRDRDGGAIPGIFFYAAFVDPSRELIQRFQVVQHREGDVLFRYVRGKDFNQAVFDGIRAKLELRLRGLPLSCEAVERIEPGPNGKLRMVVVEK